MKARGRLERVSQVIMMIDVLERIPFNILKFIGGVVSGLAFGPILGLLLYIFLFNLINNVVICITIIGSLFGIIFGYKYPKEVIGKALSAIILVTLMYMVRKFG
jgi:AAA+ ATPase superfamily predicted ATPase